MALRCKPNSCEGCSCYSHGTDFSTVEGQGSLGVMIVGEASGEHEARDQMPFRPYAPAGSLLQRCINRLGYNREQFSITNVLRCRPKNNWLTNAPWEHSAISQCRPNLRREIAKYRPRAILALGDTALRELTGECGASRGISHMRGYVLPLAIEVPDQCPDCRSLVTPAANCFLCDGTGKCGTKWEKDSAGIPVISSWHPSFIRRGKSQYQGVFMRDMQRSVVVAQGRDRSYIWDPQKSDRIKYYTRPSWDDCRSFYLWLKDNPGVHFSYDLETVETLSLDEDAREQFTDTVIRTVQFSAEEGTGWSLPWANGYRQIASQILQLPNLKIGHNCWLFDDKVLQAVEHREQLPLLPPGQSHDTLQMFHHWQPDLPAHLQAAASMANFPFPWKHLSGSDLEFYGCADVDATLRLYNTLKKTMDRDDIWGEVGSPYGYCGQVYDVRPVLAKMERRGLPVNDEKRLKLDVEFDLAEKELDTEIQAMVPDELRPVEPRRGKKGSYSYGYLNVPKDLTGLVEKTFKEVALVDGEPKMVDVTRWCRLLPFNANSPDQLKAYIKFKGYKVPKSIKEEDAEGNPKETTEKKQLLRLAQQHDDKLFLKAIEYKELGKARGTYINGFKPMSDGCVHTTFGFDTGIGQLSSKNPNVQNFPKHGRSEAQKRIVKALRGMIEAQPGKELSEWDFKSCHVLTLGFLAESANYIRIARLDMHSFVAGHFLKLWDGPTILAESDAELKARFKWLKSDPYRKHVRDDQAKHAILGIGNGLKGPGLYKRYPENFDNQKHACRFLEIIEYIYPEVFAWQKKMQQLAHDQTWLKTQFKHIRRFYEVFRWESKQRKWVGGDQAEQAISFWLSNIAFGHIREKMKALDRAGLAEKYGLMNNVHDSFVFHYDKRLREEHLAEVYPILVSPSEVLRHPTIAPNGLWIGVECAIGNDWSEMNEVEVGKVKVMEATV